MKNLDKKIMINLKDRLTLHLFNVICEVCYLFEDENFYNSDEIKKYKKYLISNFRNILNVLGKGIQDRKQDIVKLEDNLDDILKNSITILAHINFYDLFGSIVSDFYGIKKFEQSEEKYSNKNFIEEVNIFIDFIETIDSKENTFGKLLSCIPYSMTKENYFDYILESFKQLFEGKNKGQILHILENLKFQFCPYEEIKNQKFELKKIIYTDFSEKTEEQLDALLEEIEINQDKYYLILGSIASIYDALVDILSIYNFVIDEDYLFSENFILKDMFYSVNEMIENEDFELLSHTILENCIEESDVLIEKINKDICKLRNFIKGISYDNLTDSMKIFIAIENFRLNFNDEDIFKFKYIENSETADLQFIKEVSQQFIDFVNNLGFSNNILKKFRQEFFNNIPYPFDSKFLKRHLKNIVPSLSYEDYNLTCTKLLSFMYPNMLSDKQDYHEHKCGCSCSHHH